MGGIRAGCSLERCLTPLGKRGAFMIGGKTYVRRAREPFHPLSPLLFHFAGERNEEFSCSGEQQRCRRRRCTYGRSHTAGATREKEREKATSFSRSFPPLSLLLSQGFFSPRGTSSFLPFLFFRRYGQPFIVHVLRSPFPLFVLRRGWRAGGHEDLSFLTLAQEDAKPRRVRFCKCSFAR